MTFPAIASAAVPSQTARRLTALTALVLLAGCGGEKATSPVTAEALNSPGSSLVHFVAAAGRSDADGMWAVLSRATRSRLGPTLEQFEAGGRAVTERRAALVAGAPRLLFAQVVGPDLAVAVVTGDPGDGEGFAAYAAPIRLEQGDWRVVLDDGIRILPVRPDPDEAVVERTKLAAEITGDAPIAATGLWFDEFQLEISTGRVNPRRVGIIAEAPQPLRLGQHVAVAFASAGSKSAALAWTFSVAR